MQQAAYALHINQDEAEITYWHFTEGCLSFEVNLIVSFRLLLQCHYESVSLLPEGINF